MRHFIVSIYVTLYADLQILRRSFMYAPFTPTDARKSKVMYKKVGYLKNQNTQIKRMHPLHTYFLTGVPDAVPACENSAMVAQKLLRLSLSKAALAPLTETMLVAALVDSPYK
jgi:hypothetical protein